MLNGEIKSTEKDHRCFCRQTPLLGKYGKDRRGGYYHLRYRQEVDIKVYKGYIKVKCGFCKRFHTVRFGSSPTQITVSKVVEEHREVVAG